MSRYIERTSDGTLEITPDGWVRVFNADGKELCPVKPGLNLWFYINEQSAKHIRAAVQQGG